MLGEIALYSFIILLLSGTFLTLFYGRRDRGRVRRLYVPLRGNPMSEAYASTCGVVRRPRRSAHAADPPLAALFFVAAIIVHMFRVFFTGAFRKPREINWVIGSTLALLAWSRASPATRCPTTCCRAPACGSLQGIILAIPVVGTYLCFFVFGGEFPGELHPPALHDPRAADSRPSSSR